MATQEPLPSADGEFDTLQVIIVTAVTANATAWSIPTAEITKVTTAQAPWTSTWAIAKDKQNSTSAQKKAKDLARAAYEKVLRPFIQKWIFLNETMDASDVEECGLKPRDTSHTPATKPLAGTATVKPGASGELIAKCVAQAGAKYYGCIMTEGGPLPSSFEITSDGKIIPPLDNPSGAGNGSGEGVTGFQIDLTSQREKHFTGLTKGKTYYFYFYLVNAAGVSPLSAPVSIVC